MSNTKNVTASKPGGGTAGAYRVAPYGTTLPTSPIDELDEAFVTLGYISQDGYTYAKSIDVSTTKDWGGNDILTSESSSTKKFKQKFMEALNVNLMKFLNEDENVEGADLDTGIAVYENDFEHKPHVIVIDEVLTDGVLARTVIPNGTITSFSDVQHAGNAAIGNEVEITAKKDPALIRKINGEDVQCSSVTYYKRPQASQA